MLINDDSLRRLNLSMCPNSELYVILFTIQHPCKEITDEHVSRFLDMGVWQRGQLNVWLGRWRVRT